MTPASRSAPVLEGLPPIVGEGARVLILGSMPGALSLQRQEYYAHPRNAFWRITGELLWFDASAPYDERVAALRAAGVAVWDVLRLCRRPGSLDSAIDRNSMVANDFAGLFAEHPMIERVFFNGATAAKSFASLVSVDRSMVYQRLPSTSPAHTMSFAAKLAAWTAVV